jgi:serine protease Do
VSGGGVKLPWIGADGQSVTSDLAPALGLNRPEGVLLKSIYPGGPAANAGLKVGDVILSIDGNSVDDMQSLNYYVATHKAGDAQQLQVSTNGHTRGVTVRLALPPENPPRDASTIGGRNPLGGAKVENLSPAVAVDLQMDLMAKGVVVVSVSPQGYAGNYGFQAGDIVRVLNGQTITSVGQLKRALDAAGGHWDMVIDRGGQRMTLRVDG